MIGGIVTLGSTYLLNMLTGAILLDIKRDTCRNCQQVGGLMFVPGIGPLLAIEPAVHAEGWLALYGAVHAAGAVMMIAGIIKYRKSKRAAAEMGYGMWQLPQGRSLAFDVAASPYQLGPKMALRF
jgi:hypothetical protein